MRDNESDAAHADSVFFSEGDVSTPTDASLIPRSYFKNDGFGEFGKSVPFSFVPDDRSVLGNGVSGIVASRANEKVFRPNTRPIVAVVKNAKWFRDPNAMGDIPSNFRCPSRWLGWSNSSELAVAAIGKTILPSPARSKFGSVLGNRSFFVYFGPKASLKW